ncbi:MAG: four helix bundle suffix domain-containing protein [Paludibacteraceae bacterium]|nr:four helix bundle suffix domain-containing protein [Paludibacteraceae bacterium]
MPTPILQRHSDGTASVLRKAVVYTELRFYQRAEILYQLTVAFCEHFLPKYGDRTVDQMVQAARSTSSNIAEGSSDGQTSVETELKLLGIARGSNLELLNDYTRYLDHHHYVEWHGTNPRFEPLYQFCKGHLNISDYQPYFDKWTDEEFANCAICLCHMIDKGMTSYIAQKDREFVEQGGIRERMTAARMDYRNNTKKELDALRAENTALKAEVAALKAEVAALKAAPTGKSGRPG